MCFDRSGRKGQSDRPGRGQDSTAAVESSVVLEKIFPKSATTGNQYPAGSMSYLYAGAIWCVGKEDLTGEVPVCTLSIMFQISYNLKGSIQCVVVQIPE